MAPEPLKVDTADLYEHIGELEAWKRAAFKRMVVLHEEINRLERELLRLKPATLPAAVVPDPADQDVV